MGQDVGVNISSICNFPRLSPICPWSGAAARCRSLRARRDLVLRPNDIKQAVDSCVALVQSYGVGSSVGTMSAGGDPAVFALEASGRDPRPDATPEGLRGGRCVPCGYPMLYRPPLCPSCGGSPVERATFGPGGTVWSSTVLRVRVADRKPPAVLAYVDFDEGPRALVHVDSTTDQPLLPGTRVRLLGRDDRGDPLVTAADAFDHADRRARP